MARKRKGLDPKKLDATKKAVYINYINGASQITEKVDPLPGGNTRYKIGVTPFGEGVPTGAEAITAARTTWTAQAAGLLVNNLAVSSGDRTNVFGHETDGAKIGDPPAGWYPALCKLTLINKGGTVKERTSHLTGRKYKTQPRRSGQVPFGRGSVAAVPAKGGTEAQTTKGAIELNESIRQIGIVLSAAAAALSNQKLVTTFEPELFKKVVSDPALWSAEKVIQVAL